MRGLLWVLALFALAVAAALGARLNDGYVLLVSPPWRLEVSLTLFVLAILFAFALLHLVLRGLALTFGLPAKVQAYRSQRQQERSAAIFQDAVRLLFEGRFGQALKRAAQAHAAGMAPGLSALIAARAAQRMREPLKQQGWLDRAKVDDPRTEAATLMLEAEMLNESRRFDQALAVLKRLQDKHGLHLAALRLELRARQGCRDWSGVLRVTRQLEKRETLLPELTREIKLQAHLELVAAHDGSPESLAAYLRQTPKGELTPRLVGAVSRKLVILGDNDEARRLIETSLDVDDDERWDDKLVRLYGQIEDGDMTSRLALAEKWLHRRPQDGSLLLSLGRLCLRQRLWGKAQSYLEASLAIAESREAHLELADLFEQLGKTDECNRHYRASARFGVAD